MVISRITKVILKNCKKIGKMTPLTVKNGIFKKFKSLQFIHNRFSRRCYDVEQWSAHYDSLVSQGDTGVFNVFSHTSDESGTVFFIHSHEQSISVGPVVRIQPYPTQVSLSWYWTAPWSQSTSIRGISKFSFCLNPSRCDTEWEVPGSWLSRFSVTFYSPINLNVFLLAPLS